MTESIHRSFLNWSVPALPQAARLLADHYADDSAFLMHHATVVLPGARPGRRLKELLVDEAERRGLRLTPPSVTTIGALPELLYRASRPIAEAGLARRMWLRTLREAGRDHLRPLLSAVPASADLRGWMRAARSVEALHREVAGAGLRFRDVVACCTGGLLFSDEERWSVLAAMQDDYAESLRAMGHADRDLARLQALDGGAVSLPGEVWLVGVSEMPPVAKRLLEAAASSETPVRALVHAPDGEAAGFDDLGCVRPEAWLGREVPLSEDHLAICGRPAEQAREAVRFLAGLDGRFSADEIMVVAPDEELVPFLEQRLEQAGVPVRAAEGTPVERTRPARLLSAVADYLDGRRFDACAALARHPDLWRWLRREHVRSGTAAFRMEDGWLEALDRYFSDHLPGRLAPDALCADHPGAGVVQALCRALDDPRLLGRFRGRRTTAAWAAEVMELLLETYGDEPLDRRAPADRRLLEALQALRGAADELRRLPAAVDEECEAATAIRLLLDALHGAAVPPDPERRASEILGWLELHLDDAPVAVVTGFNEPFLPESLNGDAFLPNALRTRLGLADNETRYARDAYHLTALLHCRAELRVIAGRRTAQGDPLRPSRLLFAVPGRAVAERVRRFYGSGEVERAEAAAPAAEPSEEPAASESRFRLPPEPVLRFAEPPERLPVTAFRSLLQDPYGFALERVLRLESLDDGARELDALRFGELAHDVLEAFGHSPEVESADARRVRDRLGALLDEHAAHRYRDVSLPAVRIQVEQLRARLDAFARWHARWIADGWRVVGVECRTDAEGVPFLVDGVPIRITGRIDRIDYHPERRVCALFDYKTGDTTRTPEETHRAGRGSDRAWVDLQLPLYRHLLPAVRDANGSIPTGIDAADGVQLGYLCLCRDLDQVTHHLAPWSDDELAEADECARQVVRLLRANEFRFVRENLSPYLDGPVAALLGRDHLESAAAAGAWEAE